jgi:hypothetical protein
MDKMFCKSINLDAKIIDEQFGFNKVVFEKKILTHFTIRPYVKLCTAMAAILDFSSGQIINVCRWKSKMASVCGLYFLT